MSPFRLADISLLTSTERRQVLADWAGPGASYAAALCLHELFEGQVGRAPGAVAVSGEGGVVTYGVLNARANALARELRARGVGPERVVGLCLERSVELVVAILGVLKAGGAYLPLDPTYPAEHLRFLVDDARVGVVLTQESVRERVPATSAMVLCLEDMAELRGGSSESNPESGVTAGNLAYVIYTSGSTGRPKGVLISHGNVGRLLAATEGWFHFGAEDVWTLGHSYAFDFSVWELWGALAHGGRLVVVPEWVRRSPEDLYRVVVDEGVTVLNQTPSAFRLLQGVEGWRGGGGGRALRLVIFGGEALDVRTLRPWVERQGMERPRLVNMYGITETTVHVTYHALTAAAVGAGESSIGVPIPDLRVYVLDGRLEPVPVGVPGELYVGGAGLARGYWQRPGLTAERFIPDPYGKEAGGRLYRTGDMGRWREDATLEYVGRQDGQVKIRGFRIELGEIEGVLAEHAGVGQAVVAAQAGVGEDKRLVAYVVPREGAQVGVGELRRHVQERLPSPMVPAAWVVLGALPMTPSGKVDRRALPAPGGERPEMGEGYQGPRTEQEEVLARIWAEVLGVERVGVGDNFFALGGDSILSLQVVARARGAGLYVTPRQVFQYPSIGELAGVVGSGPRVEVEQGEVTGAVPLTPIQRWFFEQELVEPQHFNQAVFLAVRAPLEPGRLGQVVERLLGHHDALRLRFRREAEGWEQEGTDWAEGTRGEPFSGSGSAVFEHVEVGALPEAERASAVERAAARVQASLDLASGRLLRVVLFTGGAEGARLLLVAHHLVVDGVSWRILLEDLLTGYEQLSRGLTLELPAKTTSFKQWAERLRAYARVGTLAEEVGYWEAGRSGPVAALPVDHAGGDNTVASAGTVEVALTVAETQALVQEVPAAYRTQINDVLLTAVALALASWTGQGACLVDVEGHGREELFGDAAGSGREELFEEVDLSRTVGWFTSLFPLRLELEVGMGPGAALRSVKEQLRGVPGRGLGYGVLRYLSPDEDVRRRLAAGPPAEVSFNYLGQLDQVLPKAASLALALESPGPTRGMSGRRAHSLEIAAGITAGRLRVVWTFSTGRHARSTVERLAEQFVEALRSLIVHCSSPQAGGCTPSDFPLVRFTQTALDRLVGAGREIEDIYPLSALQSGLLFHSLYAPESGVYFEQVWCTVDGDLDAAAFRRAWQGVVDRHAILRTGFVWEGMPEPVQIVRRRALLPWEEQDWRGLTTAEQSRRLESYLETDRARGFELGQAPLMRLALLRLADDGWRLVWSHHHLLLDGWSLPLLLREVLLSYDGSVSGRDVSPPPSRPYRDFIAWLERQDSTAARAFWRKTLEGFTASTPLVVEGPAGRGRHGGEAHHAEQRLLLSPEATSALERFGRQRQLTLNTMVQAAWALLLSRYCGEEDVLFGTTVSGRSAQLPGIERMLGLFINALPVRVRVRSDEVVLPWLQRLQDQLAELRQYEWSPLTEVQGQSDVPRGQPLFESLVVFENYPIDRSVPQQLTRFRIQDIGIRERTNYPLTLVAVPRGRFSLHVFYDGQRFDDVSMRRMLGHLETLLRGVVESPDERLADIPLLSRTERRQVLADWAGPGASYAAALCLHELFEGQVGRAPGAVAVSGEGGVVTYGVLNARANALARELRARGVGPERVVGLCLERSVELVVAILGVLKAGGAYLPLDPTYPAEHLRFLVDDARVGVVLTQESVRERVPATSAMVLCLEDMAELRGGSSESNPESGVTAGNLAYVIYTSGSTGRPKGVLISHGNVGRLLAATEGWFHFGAEDVWTLGHSYAFDFSVWELWGALAHGGRLVVVPEWVRRSPEDLYRVVVDEGVTVLNQTPSAFRLLQGVEGWRGGGGGRALRLVIFGGEALDVRTLGPWVERQGMERPRLVNMYGITETTVHVTYHALTAAAVGAGESSIGVPIPDLRVYVLDGRLEPVPVGVPGELYVGGAGLARGYWQRPGLTAERFIPDPYGKEAGGRLYRTGDMGRWREDATLEYVGRQDGQVKIRGFRIELGEIEGVLAEHAGVGQAVVAAQAGVGEDKRLVAYVVPREGAQVGVGELRRHVQERLPSPMVPAAWVVLGALPMTPSGKVDRRALPAPGGERPEMGEGYQGPRTEQEEVLARIWAEVLGVERVGVGDNFFALGGDSILSLQVVARARGAGLYVTPRQVFQYPSIGELAGVVGSGPRVEVEQGEVTGAVPLTPIQRWFFEQELVEPQHFNQAVFLAVRAPLEPGRLGQVVERLLGHHDALRLRFRREAEGWEQEGTDWAEGTRGEPFSGSGSAVFEHVEVGALPEAERASAVERAAARVQASLDLASGRLLRVVLFTGGAEGARLLLVAHHLVVDGVSWRILLEDLLTGYEQLSRGLALELPAKTTSFKQWAERLRAYARVGTLAEEVGYWEAGRSGPVAALPVDHAGGDNTVASAGTVEVALTVAETQALVQEVPAAYRTQINDVLLTAVALALASWTGQGACLVDVEGHGREELFGDAAGSGREELFEEVDLSRTVGWFTSLFPLRLELEVGMGPGAALRSVKEQLRGVPGRGLGYGVLRYLSPDEDVRRRLAAGPPAEVSFNYLGQLDRALPGSVPFTAASEPSGPLRSDRQRRSHALDINGGILESRLHVAWTFSVNIHRRPTIERVADEFLRALRRVIAHCQSPDAGGYTPSDFPFADLSQAELDDLVARADDAQEPEA